jgi:CRISPR/Cas system-associated endonuclease/helicase Cas3
MKSVSFDESCRVEQPVFNNRVKLHIVKTMEEAYSIRSGKTVCVCSTVQIAQNTFGHLDRDLIHAQYLPEDKESLIEYVLRQHGENPPKDRADLTVSTNLIQSSLNISWDTIIEETISPESTIQILGRAGRFDNRDILFIIVDGTQDQYSAQSRMASRIYSRALCRKWIEHLSNCNIRNKTDMYNARRDFNEQNHQDIFVFLDQISKKSHSHVNRISFLSGGRLIPSESSLMTPNKKNIRCSRSKWVLMRKRVDGQYVQNSYVLMNVPEGKCRILKERFSDSLGDYKRQISKFFQDFDFKREEYDWFNKDARDSDDLFQDADSPRLPLLGWIDNRDFLYYDVSKDGSRGLGLCSNLDLDDDDIE